MIASEEDLPARLTNSLFPFVETLEIRMQGEMACLEGMMTFDVIDRLYYKIDQALRQPGVLFMQL